MGIVNSYPLLQNETINNLKKQWKIIITRKNKVYDLTTYINSHPGGKFIITNNTENDNSESFKFHSKHAKKKWKKYQIGILKN